MTKDSKDMRDCGPGGTLARLLINSAAMPQDLHLMEWIAELQVNEFGTTPQPRHQNVIPHRLKMQQISTNINKSSKEILEIRTTHSGSPEHDRLRLAASHFVQQSHGSSPVNPSQHRA